MHYGFSRSNHRAVRALLLAGCALASAATTAPAAAAAQTAAPTPSRTQASADAVVDAQTTDDTGKLVAADQKTPAPTGNDIVVTARRRDESLSRVPIAVTVLGSEDLIKSDVQTDADLQRTVPGLTIRETQGNNSLTYSLRGQSADIFSGSPPAVVTYLNEVPTPVTGASTFFDLQSVQVLKGPQGTLFGRNATGGAVLFTTAKPTDQFEGNFRARVANYGHIELEGAINVPLVPDKVLLRGAFDFSDDDGYIHDRYTGKTLGAYERDNGRLTLALKPSDGVSNTTMVQYGKNTGTNTGASYTYSVYAPGETNNGYTLTSSAGLLFGPTLDLVTGPGSWAAYLAAHPKAYAPGLLAYVAEQRRLGSYVTNHPFSARHYGENWTVTNTTEIELNEHVRFRNIFGLIDSYTDSTQPQLGAPYATILTANLATGVSGNVEDLRAYTEEPQIQGTGFAGALDYIVGGFFERQNTDTTFPQTYFDPRPVIPFSPATNRFRIKDRTYAAYAQGTYDLTSLGLAGISITGGFRYTRETVYGLQLPGSDNFGSPRQHRTFDKPSWEAGLQYQANPRLLVYIKTRGSFRSGGYNGTLDPAFIATTSQSNFFKPETTEDVEAGLKFAGRVFGRQANFDIALFDQWIHDVQRVEFPDPDGAGPIASIAITTNVPEERVRGIEAQGSITPTDWLRVGGQLAVTDADFTENKVVLFGTTFAYGPVGDTPKTSGMAFGELYFPTQGGADSEITLRGEVYAQTGQYFSNAANSLSPRTRLPGYTLVNGRLSWNGILGSNFSAALYGENLLDRTHFVGGMQLAVALGHNAAVVGRPRTYGLEVSMKF